MATHTQMAAWTHQELMTHDNPTGGVAFLTAELAPASAHLMLEFGLNQDLADDWQDWTLTDVTSDVLQADGATIPYSKGRADEQSLSTPAKLAGTLLNDNGAYTIRNQLGTHFPYLKQGIPVRLGANLDDGNGYQEWWSGYLSGLNPGWDSSGKLPVAALTAGGVLERLGNGKTPLRSPLTRGISSGLFDTPASHTTLVQPILYYPFEEAAGATIASEFFGGPGITPHGALTWSADDTLAGSAPLPTWPAGAGFNIVVPTYAPLSPARWRVQCVLAIPTGATADATLLSWKTTGGTGNNWRIQFTASTNTIKVECRNAAGTELLSPIGTAVARGVAFYIAVDAYQAGTTLDFVVWITDQFGSVSGDEGLSPIAGFTLGALSTVTMSVGAGVDGMTFGQFSLSPQTALFVDLSLFGSPAGAFEFVNYDYQYALGFLGEGALSRLVRICAEEGIKLAGADTLFLSDVRVMGPQPVATLLDIIRECEAADGGLLIDGVEFGLAMFPASGRINRAVDFTVDVGAGQLADTLTPATDNQRLRNEYTVNRPGGGSARFVQPEGEPYAATGPGGVGDFDDSKTLNVRYDDNLLNRAAWLTHLGCVDEDRYPAVALDLAATTALASSWAALGGVDVRMALTSLPAEGSTADAGLYSEGVAVVVSPHDWTVSVNASPSSPYDVAVVGTAKVNTPPGGSLVSVNATAGATSLTVATTTHVWTTSAAQYPLDLSVGGCKVHATACTGATSPQVFTISASPRALAAGLPVRLWTPAVIALGEEPAAV